MDSICIHLKHDQLSHLNIEYVLILGVSIEVILFSKMMQPNMIMQTKEVTLYLAIHIHANFPKMLQ